ncbi:hypothetical protein C9J22_18155 [Photobacterium phosphoreum]|uniref:EpsG family protein n=1 Tax=Photobacterium phosphoreum TaxID=659 RepID=UPI000D16B106|nr:EpsG family protein [Photobacterium phosphoreum]PSU68041.1 hypothetical protein C9J22_18155 [Photobacterium phosphoreum]
MILFIIPSILVLLSIFDLLTEKRSIQKVFLCFLLFFTYTIIFSLRYKVGVDWYNYQTYFDSSGTSAHYELGFYLINYISKYFGFNYWFVSFLASTVFIVFFINRAYKDFEYPILFISLYLLFGLMNQIETTRLLFALSFLFFSIGYIKNNQKIKAVITIILGALFFHQTIIVYLIFVILSTVNISNKTRVIIIIISLIMSLVIIENINEVVFISKEIAYYISNEKLIYYINQINMIDFVSPITKTLFLKAIFCCVMLILTKDEYEYNMKNTCYLNMGVIYFLVFTTFSFSPTIVYRLSDLFSFGFIAIIYTSVLVFKDKKRKMIMFSILMIMTLLIYFRPLTNKYYIDNIITYHNYIIHMFTGNDYYHRDINAKKYWNYE